MIGSFYSGEAKEWNAKEGTAKGFAGQCSGRTIQESFFHSLEMLQIAYIHDKKSASK